MTKVQSTKDLPKWFKLDNYEILKNLEPDDLKVQLSHRTYLLESEHWEYDEVCQWEQIQSEDILLVHHDDPWENEQNRTSGFNEHINISVLREKYALAYTLSINGFDSLSAFNHGQDLMQNNLIFPSEDNMTDLVKHEVLLGDVDLISNKLIPESNKEPSCVSIRINLADFMDKEIKNDLNVLLPKWREQLNIPEPDDVFLSKPSDHNKILSYKIIPLIDLMIWAKQNKTQIAHSIYTVALYPYGEKGETEFKQTIIPFFKKIISEKYRELT
jgi:hypothetical protein